MIVYRCQGWLQANEFILDARHSSVDIVMCGHMVTI
jgi:hypothetical protein